MIPPSARPCWWTLAIAAISFGCAGKSQGTGAEGGNGGAAASFDAGEGGDTSWSGAGADATSCDLRSTYTSVEAVTLARCSSSLPQGALLISIVSDGSGTLDSTGHDRHWSSAFWDPSTAVLYYVTVNAFGVEVSYAPDSLSCMTRLEPLDSAIVVPDAVRRLGTSADIPLLMRQTLACTTGDSAAVDQRYVATSKQGEYTFVLYDSSGRYLSTCPCSYQDPTRCDCIP
jgi:hypothetical protein